MRIERLDLTRFGNFTDHSLDLSAPGTHLILGANEAGKTTAMVAIRQLFFGIPARTNHAFLHEMRDLRFAALLNNDNGGPLEVVRLKKTRDPLQDSDGNPLSQEVLARLLHGVDERVFTSLFTIGHDEIAAGGEALLASDGEVGKAIFSASRGTTDLAAVLRTLDGQAADLFKSGGRLPALNAAISAYKDERSEVNELSRSAAAVVRLDEDLDAARKTHGATVDEKRELAKRTSLLEEIRNNRPHLAARHDHLLRQLELGAGDGLVDVALREPLKSAREQRKAAQTDRRNAESALERLGEKLNELVVDSELLDQREAIEQLQTDVGGYRQNLDDLPGLQARADSLARELEQLRAGLPDADLLTEDGLPRLTVNETTRIEDLAEERGTLFGAVEHADKELRDATSSLEKLRGELGELAEPVDVGTLSDICVRIRTGGALEADRDESTAELDELHELLTAELNALGLGDTEPGAVGSVPVPSIDTIRRMREEMKDLVDAADAAEAQIDRLEEQQAEATGKLEELLETDQPPSIDELDQSRAHREHGWQLVREAWLGPDDGDHDQTGDNQADPERINAFTGGRPLDATYEAAVAGADNVADRLRLDAKAVAERVSLESAIEQRAVELEEERQELDDLQAARTETVAAWKERWEPIGVVPDPPAEMEQWHDRFRNCVQQAQRSIELSRRIAELDSTIGRHRSDLEASLALADLDLPEDLSLTGLLDHAENLAAGAAADQKILEDKVQAVATAEDLLTRRNKSLVDAKTEMDDWERRWSSAVELIGLDATATPAEARAVLSSLAEIRTKGGEFSGFERRIDGVERRNRKFNEEVAAVLANLTGHEDAAELEPSAAVKTLARRTAETKEVAAQRRTTIEERDAHIQALDDAEGRLAEADATIGEMVETTGLTNEADLAEAIARSEQHAELAEAITRIEEDLRSSTGKPIDQIVAEASEAEELEIDSELDMLSVEAERIDQELTEQATRLGELQKERSLVDATDTAAEHMLSAQQSLAEVVDLADEYVRIVLARHLLEEQVTEFRDENQGPLLERARVLFSSLTLGRYTGVDTDTDDKGNPFILAERTNGKRLTVEELSTGTRDQLYLALRLAALEQFMERRGPLPLVLDDLLVHFDDQRTEAGLQVLDTLADETQILLFSHHHQVARQAEAAIPADRLTVHEL